MSSISKTPIAVVVIPTYNESENLSKMIPILFESIFPTIKSWDVSVVVVDSNSPDGTGKRVKELSKKYDGLHIVEEEGKNGIGTAYMKGFEYAIKELDADAVIEFDADFQHPVGSIPVLLSKLDEGFDLVLGSRTIKGGSEPVGRSAFRVFLTNIGGFIARFLLFFPGKYFRVVTDPTTGLKASRVETCFRDFDFNPDRLYSKKFGYKLQLLYENVHSGIRYAEIPLRFDNRAAGKSKFESGTIFEILFTCIRARFTDCH